MSIPRFVPVSPSRLPLGRAVAWLAAFVVLACSSGERGRVLELNPRPDDFPSGQEYGEVVDDSPSPATDQNSGGNGAGGSSAGAPTEAETNAPPDSDAEETPPPGDAGADAGAPTDAGAAGQDGDDTEDEEAVVTEATGGN